MKIAFWELSGVAKRPHYTNGTIGPWQQAFILGGR